MSRIQDFARGRCHEINGHNRPTIPLLEKSLVPSGIRFAMRKDLHIGHERDRESHAISEKEQAVLFLLLRDAIERLKRDHYVYRTWLTEVRSMEQKKQRPKLAFDWPSKAEFEIFKCEHIYDELNQPSEIAKLHKNLLSDHRAGIQKALDYSFTDFGGIDKVLPRHHYSSVALRRRGIPELLAFGQDGLRAIGELKDKWKEEKYSHELQNIGKVLRLDRFIINAKKAWPMTIDECITKIPYPKRHHFQKLRSNDQLSVVILEVLGAVYRDGGMEGVMRVIAHADAIAAARGQLIVREREDEVTAKLKKGSKEDLQLLVFLKAEPVMKDIIKDFI